MWFANVDFPEELIDALEQNRLVIFAGAGVSNGAPSSLPSFEDLARQIFHEVGRQIPPGTDYDRILGDLDLDDSIDVHDMVHRIISNPQSVPNELHENLVRLARRFEHIRIVTTNYDPHFSTTAETAGLSLDEYRGPALPLGDDFSGLVYLHGSVKQPPEKLVVTDGDFGRAYLVSPWATRFLSDMFRKYTVLFVGYSNSDLIMRYLGMGLSRSDSPGRFALVREHDPGLVEWRRYGIVPITFPPTPDGDEYVELLRAIEAWATYVHMGSVAHRQRIRELVALRPPEVPADQSYLEAALRDPVRVRFFTEYATDSPFRVEWMRWASSEPLFAAMFDDRIQPSDPCVQLARWFASMAVQDKMAGTALDIVRLHGGKLSPLVWSEIAAAFHSASPKPRCLRTWTPLLCSEPSSLSGDYLEWILLDCNYPTAKEEMLLMLDALLATKVVLERRWMPIDDGEERPLLGREVQVEIKIAGKPYGTKEAWERALFPHVDDLAIEVISIVDRQLRHARRQLELMDHANERWDPMSFRRSAIEQHSQDDRTDGIGVLVDVARDAMVSLTVKHPEVARLFIEQWEAAASPLMRRIAIHCWCIRADRSADEKIAKLVAAEWLFDVQLKHETYMLLSAALPEATSDLVEQLVRSVLAANEIDEDRELREYEIYNLLSWMKSALPGNPVVNTAFDAFQMAHPDFEPRAHPDLYSWIEVGFSAEITPISKDEFCDRFDRSPAEAKSELIRWFREADERIDGQSIDGVTSLVSQVVSARADIGLDLLPIFLEQEFRALADAAVRGFQEATMSPEQWTNLFAVLEASSNLASVADEVSRLLESRSAEKPNAIPKELLGVARQLANKLWQVAPDEERLDGSEDWLGRAINSTAGSIAQFWTHTISRELREMGEEWNGLSQEIKQHLEALLTAEGGARQLAKVVLASQVHFYFAADKEWTCNVVLPLFDWDVDTLHARQAWNGYLTWGRWHDRLLAAGMRQMYEKTFSHLDDLGALRDRFGEHVAGIVLTTTDDTIKQEWPSAFVRSGTPEDSVTFASDVGRMLREMESGAAGDQVSIGEGEWPKWMHGYLKMRIENRPRRLSFDEASELAKWILYLRESFSDGVALVSRMPAGLGEFSDTLRDLKRSHLLTSAPREVAKLVAHLLENTTARPFHGGRVLREIVVAIRSEADVSTRNDIIESATKLGCTDAADWFS